MKKTCCLSLIAVLSALTIGSCTNELKMPSTPEEIAADINARFDFNTWHKMPVKMDMGKSALISVYPYDPTGRDNAEPIFQAVTNSNGMYSGIMEVGGGLIGKDLYAVCNGQIIKGTLTNKGVDFVNTSRSRAPISSDFNMDEVCEELSASFHAQLPAGNNNTKKVSGNMRDIHIHISQAYTTVTVSWMDYGDSYNLKAYYYYYDDGGKRDDGTYKSVKEAFATPQAFYNQFINRGYLLTPAETDIENGDWVKDTYNNATYLGRTVDLRNRDEPSRPLPYFNANTTIGFVLLVRDNSGNEYLLFLDDIGAIKTNNLSSWDNAGELPFHAGAYKNNENANLENVDWPDDFKPTTEESDNTIKNFYPIVYGFEDNPKSTSDKDYDDVMFVACVNGEIDKSNIPNSTDIQLIHKGVYLFEDMYPVPGDYDMNDVIIEYEYRAYGRYQKEVDEGTGTVSYVRPYVYAFTYNFEPMHDGATYDNAFWVQYVPQYGQASLIEVYNSNKEAVSERKNFSGAAYLTGSKDEDYMFATNAFAGSFLNQSADENTLWSSKTTGVGGVEYNVGINPFIYCKNTDRQVHMSKYMFAGPDYSGSGVNGPGVEETDEYLKYYLTNLFTEEHHENYPYAMDISLAVDDNFHFLPVTETVMIFTEYPNFTEWVDSKGTKCTDWYLTKSSGN